MTIATQPNDSFIGEFPTPATTLEYGDGFGSVGLREKAIETRNSSFTLPIFSLNKFLGFSDEYYDGYEQFRREFGPKQGKTKFDLWTKSETFGIPNNMLGLARDFSPWFRNLAKHLRNLVCQRFLELNINVLKKLIILSPELLEKLLTSKEKITVTIINKMLAAISPAHEKQLKLRKNAYAQVIAPEHRLEGQVGRLQDKPDELGNIILVMFPRGPEELLKIEDVKPVAKPTDQLNQVEKKYSFILEEKEQEIEEKDKEIEEKNRQNEYLQKSIEALIAQQDNPAFYENVYLEEKTKSERLEQTLAAKIREEAEAAKAAEIASIQAKAKEELEKRKQEWEQEHQKYLRDLQAQKLETAKLQAEQLKAAEAEAEARKWQECAQNLEKMILESPNKREKDLGAQESFLVENAKLKKQVELLSLKNAELEKGNKEEIAPPYIRNYEATSIPERHSELSDEMTELLELTTEEMVTELVKLGFPGWREDGYHAKNNKVYPGSLGMKIFLDEQLSSNELTLKNSASLMSSASILEYSGSLG